MKTLKEVNAELDYHINVASKNTETEPPKGGTLDDWDAWQRQCARNKKAFAKETQRLTLMRNYLERVDPENIAATYKRLSETVANLEKSWEQHSAKFGYVTDVVFKKRRKEYENETGLPKLKKQLKEMQWLIS